MKPLIVFLLVMFVLGTRSVNFRHSSVRPILLLVGSAAMALVFRSYGLA